MKANHFPVYQGEASLTLKQLRELSVATPCVATTCQLLSAGQAAQLREYIKRQAYRRLRWDYQLHLEDIGADR